MLSKEAVLSSLASAPSGLIGPEHVTGKVGSGWAKGSWKWQGRLDTMLFAWGLAPYILWASWPEDPTGKPGTLLPPLAGSDDAARSWGGGTGRQSAKIVIPRYFNVAP